MNYRILLYLINCALVLLSCQTLPNKDNQKRKSNSSQIYDLLIDSLVIGKEDPINTTVIIKDSTSVFPVNNEYIFSICELDYFDMDSLLDYKTKYNLLADFLYQNRCPNVLSNYFQSTFHVKMIRPSSWKKIRGNDFFIYKNLYKMYPKANCFLVFSKIGFDGGFRNAILYFGIYRQSLDAWGGLVYLKRENDKWFIKKIKGLWIS